MKPTLSFDELLDALTNLISEARTTSDKERATRNMEEALSLACNTVKRLRLNLKQAMRQVLEEGSFPDDKVVVSIADMALTDEQLTVYRSRGAFQDFLSTTRDMVVAQGVLSPDDVKELFKEFVAYYDELVEAKLSVDQVDEAVEKLENCYCRPPDEGPGGVLSPDPTVDGPDAATKRQESAINLLADLTTIATFIVLVGDKVWPAIFNSARAKSKPALPFEYKVLALVAPAMLAQKISGSMGMNALKAPLLTSPTPAYA